MNRLGDEDPFLFLKVLGLVVGLVFALWSVYFML